MYLQSHKIGYANKTCFCRSSHLIAILLLFKSKQLINKNLLHTYVYRDKVDEFKSFSMLGEAQDLLESFQWTNQTLYDLEAVNINGYHNVLCGSQVQIVQLVAYNYLCVR